MPVHDAHPVSEFTRNTARMDVSALPVERRINHQTNRSGTISSVDNS
jgi:hypothetical protein